MPSGQKADSRGNSDCKCNAEMPRRTFLKVTAAGAAMGAGRLPVMAGPFEDGNDYLKLIQADKKLDPAWVRSLYERGQKETYADPQALDHIGMPVGGLFAGTLYLSGDGKLWLWDIFNRDQEGIAPRSIKYKDADVNTRNGANYIEPIAPYAPFEQGFELRLGERVRRLDRTGFAHVTFDGRYPRRPSSLS